MKNNRVLFVCLYNPKSIGVRYLEHALESAGFEVWVVALKHLTPNPKKPTDIEIQHFLSLIDKHDPLFIGFSMLSSIYLEVVMDFTARIKAKTSAPIVWGGIFATLSPERCLKHCDYVVRGEAEEAIVELAEKLRDGDSLQGVPNLSYVKDGKTVINPVRKLVQELDRFGMALLGKQNKYFIESNKLQQTDIYQKSFSYETSCSRGCPFACSYCTSSNLKKLYGGSGYTRLRSVDPVIEELLDAKAKIKNLKLVYFYDEIFMGDPEWIDEFCVKYKAEINIPFWIWTHPTTTKFEELDKLRKAGLECVSMGVQSGSQTVRQKVFYRPGSNEQILNAAKAIADAKVPWVRYEFIVRHPYESLDDIKKTYELCAQFPGKFYLRTFILQYLPGTDIAKKAVEDGFYTEEEMEKLMYAPMEEQFPQWWGKDPKSDEVSFWHHLTTMTQFKFLRGSAKRMADQGANGKTMKKAGKYYRLCVFLVKLRLYLQKGQRFLKGKPA